MDSSDDIGRVAGRRFWLVIGAVAVFVVFALVVSSLGDDEGSIGPGETAGVASLGDFSITELDALGVPVGRVTDWHVVDEGRHTFFAVAAGPNRLGRVRMLDRARGRLTTVENELAAIGPFQAATGGVVYESLAGDMRRVTYAAAGREPVELVSVAAASSRIDSIMVAPAGDRVVYRELAAGLVQRLWSVTLDGNAVELVAGDAGGTIGEGIEAPIVIGADGTVTYFADPEGDGDPRWFEVAIEGGESRPTS